MIPVIKLSELKRRPSDGRARERALEMLQKFQQSEEEFRKYCKDNNLPYTPAVCADPYGANYYRMGSRNTSAKVRLGDIFPN